MEQTTRMHEAGWLITVISELLRSEIAFIMQQGLRGPSTLEDKAKLIFAVASRLEEIGLDVVARMPTDERRDLIVETLRLVTSAAGSDAKPDAS